MLHFETEEIGPLTTMNILTQICFYYYGFSSAGVHFNHHTHTLTYTHTLKLPH